MFQRFAPPVLSILIAFIFVQSLFFKFSNASAPQHIFGTLDAWAGTFGLEGIFTPTGLFSQYVIGGAELVASIFLLLGLLGASFYALQALGALLSFAIISGAIYFHAFTPLGIDTNGDGGTLFAMAVVVWVSSVILLILRGGALGRFGRIFDADEA